MLRGYCRNMTSSKPLIGLFVYDCKPPRQIFEAHPDGRTQGWIALRDHFRTVGCNLLTIDDLNGRTPDFEIHLNARHFIGSTPAFAILAEHKFIHPLNASPSRRYRWLFTWNPELVEAGRATKIQLPHPLGNPCIDGYSSRPLLVTLIASNKSLTIWSPKHDLYRERVRAIRWFERHAPNDFALYGHGWDSPPRASLNILAKLFPKKSAYFPSWRGVLRSKREVLEVARFSIVYENVRGLSGYITEKIFDAFCAGNVPVYWGAEDIEDYIPKSCFIDKREFSDYGELYEFLRQMPEQTYLGYQRAIHNFLTSEAAQAFSTERFAKVIVTEVLKRLVES